MLHGGTYFVPNGKRHARERRRKDAKKRRKRPHSLETSLTQERTDGILFPSFSAAAVPQPAAMEAKERRKRSTKSSSQREVPVLQVHSIGTKFKETGKDSDRGGKLDPHLQRYSTVPAPSSYPPKPHQETKRKKKDWLPDCLVVRAEGGEKPEEGEEDIGSPQSPGQMTSPALELSPLHKAVGMVPSAIVARATAQVVQRESKVKAKVIPSTQPESPRLGSSGRVPEATLNADHTGLGRELRELAQQSMRNTDERISRSNQRRRVHRLRQLPSSPFDPETIRIKARLRRGLGVESQDGRSTILTSYLYNLGTGSSDSWGAGGPPTVLRFGRAVQTAEPVEYSSDEDEEELAGYPRAQTAVVAHNYREMLREGIVDRRRH